MAATRPRPPIVRDVSVPGTGRGVAKFQRHVSDEGRQKLSEIATKRHQEGGFQKKPGSKPRKPSKKRAAQRVAEAAREKKTAQDIIDVFKDGIAPHQPMAIRLKAAEAFLKVETEDAKLRMNEAAQESQKHDREELLTMLSERLTNGHAGMLLRARQVEAGDIIEGKIIEPPPEV